MEQSEVVELMKSSTSQDEWNANLQKVRAAHKGHKPTFWYAAIEQSGVEDMTRRGWGRQELIKKLEQSLRCYRRLFVYEPSFYLYIRLCYNLKYTTCSFWEDHLKKLFVIATVLIGAVAAIGVARHYAISKGQ